MLATLARSYVAAINGGAVPDIKKRCARPPRPWADAAERLHALTPVAGRGSWDAG